MNLFLAPHNDDEALFGSYIIQTYLPMHVVVVTDSYIQYERGEKMASAEARRQETLDAMGILGGHIQFLGIPDKADGFVISNTLSNWFDALPVYDNVFAPAYEEGGNWQHNLIALAAHERFDRVRQYYTYTRERDYPLGPVKVDATEEMKAKKLAALQCYKSQWANCCRQYFTTSSKDEYLSA